MFFEFQSIEPGKVEKLLTGLNNDKPAGMDDLDGWLLKVVSKTISAPTCHIFNLSMIEKLLVVPLPKNKQESFSAVNI